MNPQARTNPSSCQRVSWETLHAQIGLVKSSISFNELSKAKSENIFLLNTHRQIVFITRSCLDLFGIEDAAEAYGCRPGEMMNCYHAQINGCSETPSCKLCGAFQAAMNCLKHNTGNEHFQLKRSHNQQTMDFTAHTEALTLQGQLFMMISLTPA